MENIGESLSLFFCIPFAGMLLSIAIGPLVSARKWEKYRVFFVIFWALLFLVPFAVFYGPGQAWAQFVDIILGEYLSFIVLLFGLFCVSGNICIKGNLAGTPKVNAALLLIGTALASWIGTTGASMLLIRPMIRANEWRKRKVHSIVFFIFLVSNIGGCLTPVGDPPLFMGFIHGVPFAWSFHTAPLLLINTAILMAIYLVIENRQYKKDLAEGNRPEPAAEKDRLRIEGAHNFIFIAMIVGAVILSSILPDVSDVFNNGVAVQGEVVLSLSTITEIIIILLAAMLSFITTKKQTRIDNRFSWGAIEEVAVLFIGIFITMIPALLILEARGGELGITKNWQMFWATGALSSFLDNTPTYLVFFETAVSLKATSALIGTVAIPPRMLLAISCGAVFMGANTYIGNAPNFMVKSTAEEGHIKMPSFFGYMGWSVLFLIPVFLLDTLLFFSGLVF